MCGLGESWISWMSSRDSTYGPTILKKVHLDETIQRLLVRTDLNEYELAAKLVQLMHLHTQGRPDKHTEIILE